MTIIDILSKIENGSCHIVVVNDDGIVETNSIWHNDIPNDLLSKEVKKVSVMDYKLYLYI